MTALLTAPAPAAAPADPGLVLDFDRPLESVWGPPPGTEVMCDHQHWPAAAAESAGPCPYGEVEFCCGTCHEDF